MKAENNSPTSETYKIKYLYIITIHNDDLRLHMLFTILLKGVKIFTHFSFKILVFCFSLESLFSLRPYELLTTLTVFK